MTLAPRVPARLDVLQGPGDACIIGITVIQPNCGSILIPSRRPASRHQRAAVDHLRDADDAHDHVDQGGGCSSYHDRRTCLCFSVSLLPPSFPLPAQVFLRLVNGLTDC
jgi:hypothetical protein